MNFRDPKIASGPQRREKTAGACGAAFVGPELSPLAARRMKEVAR